MTSKRELYNRLVALEREVAQQRALVNELAAKAGVTPPSGLTYGQPSGLTYGQPSGLTYGQPPVSPSAGPAGAGALPPRAQEALAAGKKIEAIKLVREATGLGLKEAKELVDRAGAGGSAPTTGWYASSAWS